MERFQIYSGNIYTVYDDQLKRKVEKYYDDKCFSTEFFKVAGFATYEEAQNYIEKLKNSDHPENLFAWDPNLNWLEVPGIE